MNHPHQRRGIFLKTRSKKSDAANELRDQYPKQKTTCQHGKEKCKRNGQSPAHFTELHFGKQLVIKEFRKRVQNISEDKGQKDYPEVSQESADRRKRCSEIG